MKTVEELSLDGSAINIIVVPDDIDTDDKAKTFMKEILGHDRFRITRDKSYFMSIMNNIIETKARDFGFDNAASARSYASVENKYQRVSIGFVQWSAEFWNTGESLLKDVLSGNRALPTDDELKALLPSAMSYITEDMLSGIEPDVVENTENVSEQQVTVMSNK